jgi:hypothetical protein
MVDIRLVNYIQQQVQVGYDLQTIRTFLLTNGYQQQAVDEAIQFIQKPQRPKKQPSQEQLLVTYIKKYMQQGYTAQQIQQTLLQRGYPPFTVQKAIKKATKKGFSLPHIALPNVSKRTLLIIVLLILIIISILGIGWFFLNTDFSQEEDVNFDISVDIDTLAPGDILYITNDFINFPDDREYPITIYYTMSDRDTLTRADSWQISFDRDEVLTKSEKHGLERDITVGDYELNAKMSYGSTSIQAYAYFSISADEDALEEAEQTAVNQESNNTETGDTTEQTETDGTTKIDETTDVDEVVEVTSEYEVISSDDFVNYATAKDLAETDAEGAAQYCMAINDATKKDECYSAVARNSGEKSYCTEVISDPTRDACLIAFAFNKNDFTVCPDIANPFIKQSCEQLEQVSMLQV